MNDFKQWAKAAAVRAVKTLAQTAVAMIPVGAAFGGLDWCEVASVAGVAAVLSILTSVAGIPEVAGGTSPLMEQPQDPSDKE